MYGMCVRSPHNWLKGPSLFSGIQGTSMAVTDTMTARHAALQACPRLKRLDDPVCALGSFSNDIWGQTGALASACTPGEVCMVYGTGDVDLIDCTPIRADLPLEELHSDRLASLHTSS